MCWAMHLYTQLRTVSLTSRASAPPAPQPAAAAPASCSTKPPPLHTTEREFILSRARRARLRCPPLLYESSTSPNVCFFWCVFLNQPSVAAHTHTRLHRAPPVLSPAFAPHSLGRYIVKPTTPTGPIARTPGSVVVSNHSAAQQGTSPLCTAVTSFSATSACHRSSPPP